MPRTLTLADGQVAAAAAAILSGATYDGRVDVILQNTSAVTQTVVLTMQRAGGTARRVARGVLAEHEQLFVNSLPIQPDDTLLAVTTGASAVDYLVLASSGGGLSVSTLDKSGSPRSALTNESTTETVDGRSSTPVHDDSLRRAVENLAIAVQSLATPAV